MPVVALADDGFHERALPLRGEGDDRKLAAGAPRIARRSGAPNAVRTCSMMSRGFLMRSGDLGDAFDNGSEIADRHALRQEQSVARAGFPSSKSGIGTISLTSSLCSFGSSLKELLHLDMREEVRHVRLDDLGQVRGRYRCGVHDREAAQLGFVAQRSIYPGRRKPEGGLQHVLAGQLNLPAHRVHGHELAGIDLTGSGIDLLHANDVAVGIELYVVEDAHGGHDEAHLRRELTPQRLDLLREPVRSVGRVHEGQQRVADLDLEIVDLEHVRDRLLACRSAGARNAVRRRLPSVPPGLR